MPTNTASDTPTTSTKTASVSEGLRVFLLIGKFGVRVYGWLYNAEYRQQQRVQRVYNGVQSTIPVRCRTSAESLSNRLVMRNVRLYTKSGSIFLIILFSFALILVVRRIILQSWKRKWGHCSPQLPAPIRALLSQIATFSFFQIWSWRRCCQMKAKPHSVSGAAEYEYVNCSTYVTLTFIRRLKFPDEKKPIWYFS